MKEHLGKRAKNKPNQFNMHGVLIEFDGCRHTWSWTRWEYAEGFGRERHVVRRSGTIEFMKMFPSVFTGTCERTPAHTHEEMDRLLKKNGVDFIFLYQGSVVEESRFKTVEDAEQYYGLAACPAWNLTAYWFGYDARMQTWGMYDAFTGCLAFTPQSAMAQRQASRSNRMSVPVQVGGYHPGPTFH
ncbi:MAG: hypothetical protein ACM3SY_04010 [Candidatus Omnitrophota bacterium]